MTGQRRCSQTMNCCWDFWGNSRVYKVVLKGPRLLLLEPFTLYVCVWTNAGLGCSLSKHAFDMQEMVAPVSNREMVLLLLIVTGKFAAYFMFLNLTLIILSACDSQSESEEESRLLSGLLESWGSLMFSGSDLVVLDVCVWPIIPSIWFDFCCLLRWSFPNIFSWCMIV